MTKENMGLLRNALLMVIVFALLLIAYERLYPKTIEEKLFNEMVTFEQGKILETLPSKSEYMVVYKKYDAINQQQEKVGVVYEVVARNGYVFDDTKSFGEIRLLVGFKEDAVYVKHIVLEQSAQYVSDIRHYIEMNFQGIMYTEIESIEPENVADLSSGATASDSTTLIKRMVLEAIAVEYNLISSAPYDPYFGEGYEVTNEVTYNDGLIQKQLTIGNLGYVYVLTTTGVYEGYGGEEYEGSITIEVLFSAEDKILAVLVPEATYGHTISFLARNETYLNEFIGLTIGDIEDVVDDNIDLMTGATWSKAVIDTLLRALASEVSNA